MENLSIIACISKDFGIGKNGGLLWRSKEDMRFFRQTTLHHPVVMGRKTFASIGHALPERDNYVLSRSDFVAGDVRVFRSVSEIDDFISSTAQEVFIIGGATLYELYIEKASKLYLTEVDASLPADTFFPKFDPSAYTRTILKTFTENQINYQIVEYRKNDLS